MEIEELLNEKPKEWKLATKHSTYKILEYQGVKCSNCNQRMSIRSYYLPDSEISPTKEMKRTILCKCGIKLVFRSGIVKTRKFINISGIFAHKIFPRKEKEPEAYEKDDENIR